MFISDKKLGGLITVVAAGQIGDRVAAGLENLFANVECLTELTPLDVISRSMAASDLIFIVSGLENEVVARRAVEFASMARDSQSCSIVIGLVTKSSVAQSFVCLERVDALRRKVDAFLVAPSDCLISAEPDASEDMTTSAVEDYLVRLLASDIIRMNSHNSVDFSDIKMFMCDGGSAACLGVGIASGGNGGRDAAFNALHALRFQKMDPMQTGAFLVSITGSSANLTMDNFDAADTVIRGAIHENADILVAPLFDEALAGNVRVTIMAKRDTKPHPAPEMTPRLAAFLADCE